MKPIGDPFRNEISKSNKIQLSPSNLIINNIINYIFKILLFPNNLEFLLER